MVPYVTLKEVFWKGIAASLMIALGVAVLLKQPIIGAFLLTGCGNVKGSLEDIMTKVYAEIPEDERPMMLTNVEVTKEKKKSTLF